MSTEKTVFIYASSGKLVDKQDVKRIFAEVEKENLLFANKTFLDNLTLPSKIIGRERKAKELIRFLLGYKQGLLVSPEIVGKTCFPDWWMETVRKKKQHETHEQLNSLFAPGQRSTNSSGGRNNSSPGSMISSLNEHSWEEFVGSD